MISRRHARRFFAVASLLLSPSIGLAQHAEQGGEGPGQADPPEERPVVAELFEVRDELNEFAGMLGDIDTEGFIGPRREQAAALAEVLEEMSRVVRSGRLSRLSFDALLDLQTEVRAETRELESLSKELSDRASARDRDLDRLDEIRRRWDEIVAVAEQRDAPPAVMQVVAETQPAFDGVAGNLRADRDAALAVLSDIATLKFNASKFETELQARQAALETEARAAADAPVWESQLWSEPFGGSEGRAEIRRHARAVAGYLAVHGPAVAGWLVGVFAATFLLLRAARGPVHEYVRDREIRPRSTAIYDRPVSASLLVSLFAVLYLAPPYPVAFAHLVWALLPFPAATLAVTVFARPVRLSVYTLAVVLSLLQLEPLFAKMPAVDRLLIVVQSAALVLALITDLVRGNWEKAFPGMRKARLRTLIRILYLFFIAIVILDLLGFIGLASTMKNLAFGGLGLGLVFIALYYALTGFVIAALWVQPISGLAFIERERESIVSTLRVVIRWLMAVGWFLGTLRISGLLSTVTSQVTKFLSLEFDIGAVTISVSALAYGIGILVFTFTVTRLVRFIFASGSNSAVRRTSGAALAVATLIRYAIAVAGFLFAIVVMGFDLTSVTVLAGAVGVGLGFGLQNIFNNFFSGLILLLEQPIRVNDIAKVGEMIGTVRDVGIRATTIETFDGAEVIVPNADFVSKTVLNWTKSNRRRRAEIDVGVAYGSDPDVVLDILESAAREAEGIATDPEAVAVFTGFGDSSLNFRLYVWVSDLSNILVAPSRVRQRILEKLDDADIQVPFPQRDVRVVRMPETLSGDDSPKSPPQTEGSGS